MKYLGDPPTTHIRVDPNGNPVLQIEKKDLIKYLDERRARTEAKTQPNPSLKEHYN